MGDEGEVGPLPIEVRDARPGAGDPDGESVDGTATPDVRSSMRHSLRYSSLASALAPALSILTARFLLIISVDPLFTRTFVCSASHTSPNSPAPSTFDASMRVCDKV